MLKTPKESASGKEHSISQEKALQAATDEFVSDGRVPDEEQQLYSHALAVEICRRFFRMQ